MHGRKNAHDSKGCFTYLRKQQNKIIDSFSSPIVDRNNLYNSLTKGNPTLQRLESVAEVLGVPVWRLFTEDTKPELFGTIIYDGEVYSVSSKEELSSITAKIVGANS